MLKKQRSRFILTWQLIFLRDVFDEYFHILRIFPSFYYFLSALASFFDAVKHLFPFFFLLKFLLGSFFLRNVFDEWGLELKGGFGDGQSFMGGPCHQSVQMKMLNFFISFVFFDNNDEIINHLFPLSILNCQR